MKRIILLGSTGSIGENTLRVVEALSPRFQVVGLAVRSNYRKALQQAKKFRVSHVAVADPDAAKRCAKDAPDGVKVYAGDAGVEALAAEVEAEIVLCALVGMAGLKPVLAALNHGKDVALATKEVLVAAGSMVTETAARNGRTILPVDSEHNAVFQCVNGRAPADLRRVILTASGGPFAGRPEINLDKVTVGEALNHPRWNMGRKVTVDSATLMNKGLEIMEAHWLFGLSIDRIDVVVHPESIVHSLVEFVDGSVLAQMSPPDMRYAIQYALTHPERADGALPSLNLAKVGPLHFLEPDVRRFPCLAMAREAARIGGTLPAVLNAANEVAVQQFLDGKMMFSGIWRLVELVMSWHTIVAKPDLEAVMAADAWARRIAGSQRV